MENGTLTRAERLWILSELHALWHEPNTKLTTSEVRKMHEYISGRISDGAALRDAFGLPRIATALQTICLAAGEIGMRGHVLRAFILRSIDATPEEARSDFGEDVAATLSAFTRAEALLATESKAQESDDFRNLFVSSCGDMRAILLLIADCVVRMRLIKDNPNDAERRRVATQASRLYAPLAHKLGLYTLKSELEDISLKYLDPEIYYHIKEKLNETKKSRDAYIERFISPLRKKLDAEGLSYHIKGRTKSIHSICQKMRKQKCSFEGVYDLFAIRVIIDAPPADELAACWKVFSIVTYEYESNLKRLRDWLTVPKSNGYESLHITVRGPEDKWVEVQIRTTRMDEVAEHGLAAHWRYKGIKAAGGGVDDWLAGIRAALETGDEKSLSENLAAGLKGSDSVYVFSPKGDLYKLPAGATVLDFAYLIHTGVGNKCVGGRIDGRNVPIRQKLESGQRVEILTSAQQTPKADWLGIVVSARAKSKIRAAVNDLAATEGNLAREILERKLKNRKLGPWNEGAWNHLIKRLGYKETNEFYRDIVEERIDVMEVVEQYAAELTHDPHDAERAGFRKAEEFNFESIQARSLPTSEDVLVIDRNLKGIDFQMARCCTPVYGDDVFGFVTSGGGIKIHRSSCPNAAALRSRFPYRIVKAKWAGKGTGKYAITLRIVGNDDLGIVNNITSIITKEENIMLRSISIDSNDGLFSGILTVLVDDTARLAQLIKKLRTVRGVKAVSRS